MSIKYFVSNLLALKAGVVVHGCNNQGVIGGGVAAGVKSVWPWAYKTYRKPYDAIGKLSDSVAGAAIKPKLGEILWAFEPNNGGLIVANAITQEGFNLRCDTDYTAIDNAFEEVFNFALEQGLDDINIPLIGSGIGGGSWAVVEQIILDRQARHSMRRPDEPLIDIIVHCLTIDDIPSWREQATPVGLESY